MESLYDCVICGEVIIEGLKISECENTFCCNCFEKVVGE